MENAAEGTLDELIGRLATGEFERARETAWSTSAGTGRVVQASLDDEPQQQLFDVADELCEWAWELPEPELIRVQVLAEIYRRLPCSAVLFGIAVHLYQHMSSAGRSELWRQLRVYLDSEDERLADPVSYYLWCEWFEDPDREIVEEVWRCLVEGQPADRALRRILENSGPVPVDLKAELVSRVIPDPGWHHSIFLALVDSRTAAYGRWDAGWAEGVFKKLRGAQHQGPSVEAAIDEYVQNRKGAAS